MDNLGEQMKITIEWMSDTHECDTCGHSWANGAIVQFDDGRELDFSPAAHCYDSVHYESDDIFRKIFEELGHELIEVQK